MDAVGGEEAVGESLAKAVLVNRVVEVAVGRLVVFPQRRGGHADLNGGFEVVEDRSPVARLARAAAMAFIDDDEVEEVGVVFLVESRTPFVLGDGLIGGEIHLPAFDRFAVFDFVAGVAERDERFNLGVVDKDVAIRQEENPGALDWIV